MAINAIAGPTLGIVAEAAKTAAAPAVEGSAFIDSLGRLVTAAESAGDQANTAVAGMLAGTTDVHEAMIAMQQADVALQLTVQVRNKLVQAYQEIMRMPI